MFRNICMTAKSQNGEFKNVRAFVNVTEFERKYSDFSTFASDYAKRNGCRSAGAAGTTLPMLACSA